MDARVVRAMELLKEAGRLDLLAAPAAPRDRPVRRAASGVAAAVAACSPPRERKQVSGAGHEWGGPWAGREVGPGLPWAGRNQFEEPAAPLGGRSVDGDPGELVSGSEPWEEEEEVLAGPSAASWAGCPRGVKAVRATEVMGLTWGTERYGGAEMERTAQGLGSSSISGGGDRERAHDRRERMGRKEDKTNDD
ncbi:hypothetical protein NDU88_001252 [Pleurodeles waltl]|uniref:Uncharacterized protein n=1 Tax=Pleurodeles waltl TaxID=8319 RepID=A0AAV7TJK5_PLEWA|nr:hypothetical protein NDU88_001252 [Pleurodeles waltl]